LGARFDFGSFHTGKGEFLGAYFTEQEDFSSKISMQDYAEKKLKFTKFDPSLKDEVRATLFGRLGRCWVDWGGWRNRHAGICRHRFL